MTWPSSAASNTSARFFSVSPSHFDITRREIDPIELEAELARDQAGDHRLAGAGRAVEQRGEAARGRDRGVVAPVLEHGALVARAADQLAHAVEHVVGQRDLVPVGAAGRRACATRPSAHRDVLARDLVDERCADVAARRAARRATSSHDRARSCRARSGSASRARRRRSARRARPRRRARRAQAAARSPSDSARQRDREVLGLERQIALGRRRGPRSAPVRGEGPDARGGASRRRPRRRLEPRHHRDGAGKGGADQLGAQRGGERGAGARQPRGIDRTRSCDRPAAASAAISVWRPAPRRPRTTTRAGTRRIALGELEHRARGSPRRARAIVGERAIGRGAAWPRADLDARSWPRRRSSRTSSTSSATRSTRRRSGGPGRAHERRVVGELVGDAVASRAALGDQQLDEVAVAAAAPARPREDAVQPRDLAAQPRRRRARAASASRSATARTRARARRTAARCRRRGWRARASDARAARAGEPPARRRARRRRARRPRRPGRAPRARTAGRPRRRG